MSRITLLFSGGIDSTVLAHKALENGHDLFCMIFDYGQPAARQEVATACRWVSENRVVIGNRLHGKVFTIDLHGSLAALGESKTGPRVMPYRNVVMLAHALNWAAPQGRVWFGATAGDRKEYLDCRKEFVDSFDQLARSMYPDVSVEAPLLDMDKKQVVGLGRRLGVNFKKTISCYQPVKKKPCGQCNACIEREAALG